MTKGKWGALALAGAVAIGAGIIGWTLRRQAPAPTGVNETTTGAPPSGPRGFLPIPPSANLDHDPPRPHNDAGAGGVDQEASTLRTIMESWRKAILVKDADTVTALDQGFLGAPARFRTPLIESAHGDSDPRVRAFSTRVLGKFGDLTCAPEFIRLLSDNSEYVRGNAAWALTELAGKPKARQATRAALPILRRLQSEDPSRKVRALATDAVQKLN